MKFDIRKFKKISSDQHSTVLESDKGHKITVAHKALEPELRKHLSKMPIHMKEGGLVEEDFLSVKPMTANASVMPSEEEEIVAMSKAAPEMPSQPMGMDAQAPLEMPKGSTPENPLPSSAIENVNTTQIADPNKPAQDPLGYSQYEQNLMKGYGEQQQGLQMESQAKQFQAKEEQAALQKHQDVMLELKSNYDKKFQTLEQNRQQLMNDIQSSKIDPNRLYSNMSTGQKFELGIGLILGGMGAGLTGGENPVLKSLQNQIDRDVDAQRSELGKKQNLLSANMQEFGNLKDAMEMTKSQQLDVLSSKMKMAAAKAMNPMAKAQMLQEAGKLDQQSAGILQQLAQKRTMNEFLQNANKDPSKIPAAINIARITAPEMAKSLEERYVPAVNAVASIPVPKEVRDRITAGADLQKKVAELRAFADENKYSFNPQKKALGEQKAAQVLDAYRVAKGQGVFKESAKDFDAQMMPHDPTSLLDSWLKGTDKRYEDLQRTLHQEHSTLLKGYGLKGKEPIQTTAPKIK